MQIVIAWIEQDFNVISTDGYDLGKTPRIKHFDKVKTAMWKSNGNDKDILAAQEYVEKDGEGKTVIVFRKPVRDPLGLAKKKML